LLWAVDERRPGIWLPRAISAEMKWMLPASLVGRGAGGLPAAEIFQTVRGSSPVGAIWAPYVAYSRMSCAVGRDESGDAAETPAAVRLRLSGACRKSP